MITRTFDFLNRKTSEQDVVGALINTTYDADNNPITVTDGKGFVTANTFDALSQLIRTDQPEGRTLTTEYDVFGNVTRRTDAEGNPTVYSYDRLNRQTQETDANDNSTVTVFDAVDNTLSQTDKRGNTTEWAYDALNRVVTITEPDTGTHNNQITNTYDVNGNLVATTDKRGVVTTRSYDRLNRIAEELRDNILVIRNTYSEIGDLIGTEDANGNKTAMEFNQRHEMVLLSRPETAISRYQYDAMGDTVSHIDEQGREMTYVFDLRQRKIAETNGENETTTYQYDLNNNQTEKTRPAGNTWAYAFDELNRLSQITDAESQISAYEYDQESNLTRFRDANGNETRYEYDALNRKARKLYPVTSDGAATETYTYDENSNLVTKLDGNGQTQTHTYDALNRLTQTVYANPRVSLSRALQSEAMEYDGNNNPTRVTERYTPSEVRTDSYHYDRFDRLYNRTDSFGKTLSYRYDLNGNRTSLTDSDGVVTNYTFDGLNRVKTVATADGLTGYQYDRSSLIKQVSYPNNTTQRHEYDQARRSTRIHNQQNNATVSNYDYQYDENGNRIEQKETNGGAEEITTYDYDNNDRLTEVVYAQGTANQETVTYDYDAAYNRTSEITRNHSNVVTQNKTYRYNQRNQLTNVDDTLDASNDASYAFDLNGNQTQKVKGGTQTAFVFDVRDDLRQVQTGGSTVGQFLYDHQGLRIEKLGNRGTERSTYDDQSVLQQYDNTNQTRAKFDYGADRLLSLKAESEPTQFYLTDALRSVVNLTNDQGAIQARYQYDVWGNKRSEVGQSYNRFSFTGYEEDTETGLLYAKARFYDPDTGKFLSEDAWEGDNLIAPSLHKYLYAYQNPTVWVDPTGNAPEDQVTIQENGVPLYSHENPDLSEQRAAERAALRQANAAAEAADRQAQMAAQDEIARGNATAHVDQQKARGAELNSQYNDGLANHNASNQGGQSISKWRVAKDAELVKESESQVQTETNEQFVSRHLGSGSGRDRAREMNRKGVEAGETLAQGAELLQPDPISKAAGGGLLLLKGGKWIRQGSKTTKSVNKLNKDLAGFRKDLNLPAAGSVGDKSTVAVMKVNGKKTFGINAHGQPVKGVNSISKTHAEIDVLNQIKRQGVDVKGKKLSMVVDRQPCKACDQNGGIRSMVRQLGIDELTVYGPDGPVIIKP